MGCGDFFSSSVITIINKTPGNIIVSIGKDSLSDNQTAESWKGTLVNKTIQAGDTEIIDLEEKNIKVFYTIYSEDYFYSKDNTGYTQKKLAFHETEAGELLGKTFTGKQIIVNAPSKYFFVTVNNSKSVDLDYIFTLPEKTVLNSDYSNCSALAMIKVRKYTSLPIGYFEFIEKGMILGVSFQYSNSYTYYSEGDQFTLSNNILNQKVTFKY